MNLLQYHTVFNIQRKTIKTSKTSSWGAIRCRETPKSLSRDCFSAQLSPEPLVRLNPATFCANGLAPPFHLLPPAKNNHFFSTRLCRVLLSVQFQSIVHTVYTVSSVMMYE